MKIVTKEASWYDRNRSEWNNSENDTYDVVDDDGKVIKNFTDWEDAKKFINDSTTDSLDWYRWSDYH